MEYVQVKGDRYFKIQNSDGLRPFFMSIVSDSNHWMFISSNGGITAGRKNSEFALFPYYTDDKITESYENTGGKTIFRITKNGKTHVWEPFCDNYTGVYRYTRNLYKSEYGNKVIFEEFNHDLNLRFQRHWNTSDAFGFVCKSVLFNESDSEVHCNLLDGLQNLMPYGVNSALQQASSNLVDAYKKSELLSDSGLGIFALSAIIVDRAEPSESLKANVVWSHGLENPTHLLSSLQLQAFRKNGTVVQEEDVRAEKGDYFAVSEIILPVKGEKEWFFVADVDKSTAQVINLSEQLKNDVQIAEKVFADVAKGTKELLKLATAADGKQLVADYRRNSRHYSNVLFNMMRGGIFDDNYTIEKQDFASYLAKANHTVFDSSQAVLSALTDKFNVDALKRLAHDSLDKDFARLCFEYLPLKFSRRHGDPSRPWNKFSINTKSDDGAKILDYQGNWRDIFQNWEALVHSYPEFIDGMMHKFLNATTFDGYNPYRVTKDGFDWETIEPDDPWSYIGYWGDHQIIYLLKFLEFYEKYSPNSLSGYFDKHLFVYANVPYRIKSYQDILKNPKDSIELDWELEEHIHRKRAKIGADGALLEDVNGTIYKVNLIEKLLATMLAKMSNFIPEGGIWMKYPKTGVERC